MYCCPVLLTAIHISVSRQPVKDYAMRLQGKSYLDIAKAGGGIMDSVAQTRAADEALLTELLVQRVERHFADGVTTIEVKSGYGLSVEAELKQLRAIKAASQKTGATLIPTCLAAHLKPNDFEGNQSEYLKYILKDLLPIRKKRKVSRKSRHFY